MIFPYINEVQYRLNHLDEGKVGIVTLDNEDVIAPDGTLGLMPMGGKWRTLLSLGALDHTVDVMPLPRTSRNLSLYFTDGLDGKGLPLAKLPSELYDLLAGKGAMIANITYLASSKVAADSWFNNMGEQYEADPAPAPIGHGETTSPVIRPELGGDISIDEPVETRMLYIIQEGGDPLPLYNFDENKWIESGAIQILLNGINSNRTTQWFTNIINYAAKHIDDIELDPEVLVTKEEIYEEVMSTLAEVFSSQVPVYNIYVRNQGEWAQIDKTKTYDIDMRTNGLDGGIDMETVLDIAKSIEAGFTCYANITYLNDDTEEVYIKKALIMYTAYGMPTGDLPFGHTTITAMTVGLDGDLLPIHLYIDS